MRLAAARRAGPGRRTLQLALAAACVLLAGVALPAASSARGQAPIGFAFLPLGTGSIEAYLVSNGALLETCDSANANVAGGNSCTVDVEQGARVRLVAKATGAGSPFLHWDRFDCAGTDPCVVTVEDPEDVVMGTFRVQELVVVKRGDGEGTVTANVGGIDCGDDCTENVPAETEVVLTATGDHAWGRGCEPEGGDPKAARCFLRMTATRTFAKVGFGIEPDGDLPFDVRVTVRVQKLGTGGGKVAGSGTDTNNEGKKPWSIDCGSGPGCRALDLHIQTRLTLRATEDPGSRFVTWVGVCSTDPVCTFAAGTQKVLGARFEPAAQPPPPPAGPPPPPAPGAKFAVQITKVTVGGGAVVLRVVSDRAARGTLRLLRGTTPVATRRFAIPRGRVDLRYVLPRGLAGGWYRIKGTFVGPRGEVAPIDRRFQLRR